TTGNGPWPRRPGPTGARCRWPPPAWCWGPEPPDRLIVMSRPDGRSVTELRPVKLSRGWLDHAEGSVLVEFGRTRVLCAASVTEDVPRWRRGSGLGAVTASRSRGDWAAAPRRYPAWSGARSGPAWITRRWARTPSSSTVTCSRP